MTKLKAGLVVQAASVQMETTEDIFKRGSKEDLLLKIMTGNRTIIQATQCIHHCSNYTFSDLRKDGHSTRFEVCPENYALKFMIEQNYNKLLK